MTTHSQVFRQVLGLLGKSGTLEVTESFGADELEDFRITYVYAEELSVLLQKGRMAVRLRDADKLAQVIKQLIKHPAFTQDSARKLLQDCITLMHDGRLLLLTSVSVRKLLLACHKSIQSHLGILIIKGEIRYHLMQASVEEIV